MGLCFSCSKDPFEADLNDALARSRHEKRLIEAEELARVYQESSNLEESSRLRLREKEEERARELDKNAQIAHAYQYRDTERQLHNRSALDEEAKQLAKALEDSLKEEEKRKQLEDEQVKKDAELALSLQESLNKLESPPRMDENNSIFRKVPLNEEEQLAKALEESLKEIGKRKQIEVEQVKKDDQMKKDAELALSLQESLNILESPPRIDENNSIFRKAPLDLDEQLAKALEESIKETGKGKKIEDEQVKKDAELAIMFQESLNPHTLEESNKISTSPLLDEDEQRIKRKILKEEGQIDHSRDVVDDNGKLLEVNPPPSICSGCNSVVEHEGFVNILGVLWHSECFSCCACDKPIDIHGVRKFVSNSRGNFHKSCYKRYCYVCKEKKMTEYQKHPFWEENYCPAHDTDRTPKCCSCERLEPWGTNYVRLEDGRRLCLECMESAYMAWDECQPLQFEIREYFQGLNMEIKKQFPFLLVEQQALNKAEKEEKIDQRNEAVTRGICLSEEQNVDSIKKQIKGPNSKVIRMAKKSVWVERKCEVTGILILYGLPRLLTGYILAHEMMHAYLRLNGHRNLNNVLEEGLCQVLGHMWLESQRYAPAADATVDESSAAASSSSSRTPAVSASKKGANSEFEKKLVDFFKDQIETDKSKVYGHGFRIVNEMVSNSSLPETLQAIISSRINP